MIRANAFDNEHYLKLQTSAILERVRRFGDKLYLEFGGKLFYDYHAARVLPGYEPLAKLRLLQELKDKADILLCIYAGDIERKKIRADFGITYDADALKLIDDLRQWGIDIRAVVITRFEQQPSAVLFKNINGLIIMTTSSYQNLSFPGLTGESRKALDARFRPAGMTGKQQRRFTNCQFNYATLNKLERRGIRVYTHRYTKGYPTDVEIIVSDEGYGANEYIQTEKPLVIVTGPGPGSGKLATCLSQLYHDYRKGTQSGYAKFETFPVWNVPLKHPVNVAYEAATADIKDFNLIDPFHLETYGKAAVNYNRDVEIFPVLKRILETITGGGVLLPVPHGYGSEPDRHGHRP